MSTLKLRPFYCLVAAITTKELGHVELVSNGVTMLNNGPTPSIPLGNIPECQKYLEEGSHRRLYTFSPDDYKEIAGIWGTLFPAFGLSDVNTTPPS
jgi:Mn-containing catalase